MNKHHAPSFKDLESLDDLGPPDLSTPIVDPDEARITGGTGFSRATERKYEERCKDCGGTGTFYSYAGRPVGDCFKCEGTGVRKFATSPEMRKKMREQYRARKNKSREDFASDHADVVEYINKHATRWEFMGSLSQQLQERGTLSEKQVAAVRRALARDEERERKRREEAARAAADPEVLDLTPLPSGMYAVPGGDTRLKVRVNRPKKGSRWEGWIFVSDGAEYGRRQNYGRQGPGGVYEGKIREELRIILADAREASAAYGRLTNRCGVCGRLLEDEESVARGIGPICARKFAEV